MVYFWRPSAHCSSGLWLRSCIRLSVTGQVPCTFSSSTKGIIHLPLCNTRTILSMCPVLKIAHSALILVLKYQFFYEKIVAGSSWELTVFGDGRENFNAMLWMENWARKLIQGHRKPEFLNLGLRPYLSDLACYQNEIRLKILNGLSSRNSVTSQYNFAILSCSHVGFQVFSMLPYVGTM